VKPGKAGALLLPDPCERATDVEPVTAADHAGDASPGHAGIERRDDLPGRHTKLRQGPGGDGSDILEPPSDVHGAAGPRLERVDCAIHLWVERRVDLSGGQVVREETVAGYRRSAFARLPYPPEVAADHDGRADDRDGADGAVQHVRGDVHRVRRNDLRVREI